MKRYLTYGMLFLPSMWAGDCFATSIVAVRSPESVAIAADSLLTIRNADGTETLKSACKIFHSKNIYFAFSGFFRDRARGFDIISIVSDVLKKNEPFDAASEKAAMAAAAGVRDEMRKIQIEDPMLFHKQFEAGKAPLLQVLFAAYERGVPRIAVYDIKKSASFSSDGEIRLDRMSCPGDCAERGTTAYFLTDVRPVEEYLKKEKLVNRSPEETARFLVDLVIKVHTPDTGPPIDVLRIDAKGAEWIERKKECPDLLAPDH